jgi:hypothetical protein
MIYYAKLANGNIKIGWARRPIMQRMNRLIHSTGGPVKLLAIHDGDRETERRVHEQFAEVRIGRSEQFKPSRQLMSHIRYFKVVTRWIKKGPAKQRKAS